MVKFGRALQVSEMTDCRDLEWNSGAKGEVPYFLAGQQQLKEMKFGWDHFECSFG